MSSRDDTIRRERPPLRATALDVTRRLQQAGFTTYWAGGCVRDMQLGRTPKDYDVATAATPDDVVALFKRTRAVGAQFGVILVRQAGYDIEVATFRTDGAYADGRRPTEIAFSTPEEDAQRRDFTINGMFFDPVAQQIHDFVGGQADLKAGRIRAIGIAEERFEEDHLRVLRAIKFATRFDFEIEHHTWNAMRVAASKLPRISAERIRMELEAMLTGPRCAQAAQWLADCDALDCLWDGAARLRTQWSQRVNVLTQLPNEKRSFELSLAALMHIDAVEKSVAACAALRCSNYTTDRVGWLIKHQRALDNPDALTLADLKLLMAEKGFEELLQLTAALHLADGGDTRRVDEIRKRAAEIPEGDVAPPPLVTGDDLIQAGLRPGPAFKDALFQVYYRQLQNEITDKATALDAARQYIEAG